MTILAHRHTHTHTDVTCLLWLIMGYFHNYFCCDDICPLLNLSLHTYCESATLQKEHFEYFKEYFKIISLLIAMTANGLSFFSFSPHYPNKFEMIRVNQSLAKFKQCHNKESPLVCAITPLLCFCAADRVTKQGERRWWQHTLTAESDDLEIMSDLIANNNQVVPWIPWPVIICWL